MPTNISEEYTAVIFSTLKTEDVGSHLPGYTMWWARASCEQLVSCFSNKKIRRWELMTLTLEGAIFFYFSHGVRLSPLGTAATLWPILPASDDRYWWLWSNRWNTYWEREPKYSEKSYPSATLPTTNPTSPNLGSNPGRRGGKPATNRLSHGIWKEVTLNLHCSWTGIGRLSMTYPGQQSKPVPPRRQIW
jgi:hypothetical protein